MKKVKLIPSLIMLVLCIGVLAVGVFALSPISNSIAGTISISAGKASLAITGYVDNTIVYSRTELHGGMDWTIDSSKLNFDASNYFFPEQVPSKEIKLVIENLSNKPYGVFFCDYADVNATSSNIKTTGEVKSGTTTIVNASMDYYKYISVADSSTTLDQVEMTITLSVANISTSAQTGSFKYYLNVEEYNSSLNTTEEFIKVDDSLTAIEASAYANNTTVKNVIIPNTITAIGASAFSGCTSLTEITIPASVTTIGAGVFDGCTALEKIIVEAHSSSGSLGDTANLPIVEGKAWFIGDTLVEYTSSEQLLTYSTTKQEYTLKNYTAPKQMIEILLTHEALMNSSATDEDIILYGWGTYEEGMIIKLSFSIDGETRVSGIVYFLAYNNTTSTWEELGRVGTGGQSFALPLEYEITVSANYTSYKFQHRIDPVGLM